MNIKERAAYAWGRICGLFKKKEPKIEVEIEEQQEAVPAEESAPAEDPAPAEQARTEEVSASEPEEEPAEDDLSPDDIEVEIYEETEEPGAELKAEEADSVEEEVTSRDVLTQTDDPMPSRMTDEYIAWMKAQREAADAENNRAQFETEQ